MTPGESGLSAEAWTAIIAGVAIILDVLFHVVGGTWLLSNSRQQLAKEIADQLEARRKEVDDKFSQMRQEIGETFAAMRVAIGDVSREVNRVELQSYQNFVRRDSFMEMVKQDRESASLRFNKLEQRLDEIRDTQNKQYLK